MWTIANQNTKDPEGQTDGSLQLSEIIMNREDETLKSWITIFQRNLCTRL